MATVQSTPARTDLNDVRAAAREQADRADRRAERLEQMAWRGLPWALGLVGVCLLLVVGQWVIG